MAFHYPNGRKYVPAEKSTIEKRKRKNPSYGKRGMTLEDDINDSNQYYLDRGIAVIHKKPTPVQIVQVDYPARSAAVIKEAYFKQASTTDYNGIYKGKYIDFEAKETKNTTSFPFNNFHSHQIEHMRNIIKQRGICFVILRFSTTDELFLLEAKELLAFWERMKNGGRKSMTKDEVIEKGHRIILGFQPRIDYIKILDNIYQLDSST
ncbi:Holliday junction resolvase RecU [Cytobacillus sp. Sa5YUA1]|uniref:Holliday junction resolvase RecU n=1 Tax=Cytobacillus stercorigallinarum TaxID=2762240 RepID=A0ABR8QKR3_9BACI|nr:Holliday junction resolvase RecU [Cytobacillus stercorigallinarum]MBD7936105.1 Holliday junction resolvase RecU [Cytobacillus stercorigallinarum]